MCMGVLNTSMAPDGILQSRGQAPGQRFTATPDPGAVLIE